jgi:hypothetical protein
MTDLDKDERAFLIGLEKLTRETGVTIAGCGCCGSPFLCRPDNENSRDNPEAGYGFGYADEVVWIDTEDEYAWKNYGHTIVR